MNAFCDCIRESSNRYASYRMLSAAARRCDVGHCCLTSPALNVQTFHLEEALQLVTFVSDLTYFVSLYS